MQKSRVFDIMANAGPIGMELVKVLEAKGISTTTWAVAMCMALLSIELDGVRVTPDFVNEILKTIYRIQEESDQMTPPLPSQN